MGVKIKDIIKPKYKDIDVGSISDGYHTYDELYRHRMVLFACLCSLNKDKAWKSLKHHDGTMYDNFFIVGMETPYGQVSYHYSINEGWNLFDVKELDNAPEWDGHTPEDALERMAKTFAYANI